MKNADHPIYPDPMRGTGESYYNQSPDKLPCGLTKREHFAGLAMQAVISTINKPDMDSVLEIPNNTAQWAVKFADALLKQLETTQADQP